MPPPLDAAESPHKGRRGVQRLVNALFYSLSGLALAFRHESAFRQEVALAALLLPKPHQTLPCTSTAMPS